MPIGIFDVQRLLFKSKTTKRFWIPVVIVTIAIVNVIGLLRPEKYRATALVLIRQPPISDQRVSDTFKLTDMLETINVRITSYAFLADIARKLNMDAGISPDSKRYENLIKLMQNGIDLRVFPDYFKVTYTGYTAQEVYGVTSSIINQFILQSGDYYKDKAKKNVEFLNTQLNNAIADMKAAQQKIFDFKSQHVGDLPEAQLEQMSRRSRLQDDYENCHQEMEVTSQALRLALMQIKQIQPSLSVTMSQTSSPELMQLRSTQRDLKLKLEMLTQVQGLKEEHWDVIGVRKQLSLVEDQITSASKLLTTDTTRSANPEYAKLRDIIQDNQMKLGMLRKRFAAQGEELKRLDIYLNSVPSHQDKLQNLDRDLKIAEGQVEYLRGQTFQAKKASELEAQGMGPSFDIKDPPRVPSAPFSPNRAYIAVVSVILGSLAGFILVLLLAFFDYSIRSIEQAREVLRMPILGIVQRVMPPSEILRLSKRRKRRLIALGLFAVISIVGGSWGYHVYRENILLYMEMLREFLK